jgi:ABC-type multidrug transport system fused ATPase/permease subunit
MCQANFETTTQATSAVDAFTEMRLQRALATLFQGRTSFVVAHRLSTIRKADQILVMRQGQVIEQGTHEQLVALNGLYSKLARIQGTTFIEESFDKLSVAEDAGVVVGK